MKCDINHNVTKVLSTNYEMSLKSKSRAQRLRDKLNQVIDQGQFGGAWYYFSRHAVTQNESRE